VGNGNAGLSIERRKGMKQPHISIERWRYKQLLEEERLLKKLQELGVESAFIYDEAVREMGEEDLEAKEEELENLANKERAKNTRALAEVYVKALQETTERFEI
jgi:hypothetical protein